MCAVDVAQDLLVLSERPFIDNTFKLHLLCLSGCGAPHQYAKQQVLHGPIAQALSPSCRHIAIAGDILAWKVCYPLFELQVWDWKTGIMIWRYQALFIEFALLNSSLLLLLFPTERQFSVFSVDQWKQDARDGVQPTSDRPIRILELPPLARGIQLTPTKCSIAFDVPAASPDARPSFAHDPSASVIFFQFEIAVNSRSFFEHFLMAIPLSTVLSHCSPSASSPVIPWENWGPRGTRILLVDPHARGRPTWTSVLGSKCALVYLTEPPEGVLDTRNIHTDLVLLDFHPAAALWDPGYEEKRSIRFWGARHIGEEAGLLPRDAFTTLPFRATYRSEVIDDPFWPINFSLTEDGFYFAVEPETEQAMNGGFLGFSI
ncbi:hypothetical protein GSI_10507 [Ganoderma sinense ZZ0214-1]|uniref:DUF1618 domain-containing protein n=1 Tax=Ganoderma sinense ZZ0214-1 TaxID=1077348 RepID=A0A2G8S0R2_9APHY|nr:hypothetical protein GSI_10507 [Ganoderma sinense ZZ0214-1]